jgi:hypothetical protein
MLVLHPELWDQGCSLCRAALENSPEGQAIAAGLNHDILLMLILSYCLFGTFGYSSTAL